MTALAEMTIQQKVDAQILNLQMIKALETVVALATQTGSLALDCKKKTLTVNGKRIELSVEFFNMLNEGLGYGLQKITTTLVARTEELAASLRQDMTAKPASADTAGAVPTV